MMSIEVDGLEEAQEMLAFLHGLGNTIMAAQVLGHSRKEDPSKNNKQVLEWLGENHPGGNRNFHSLTDAEQQKMNKIFVDKLHKALKKYEKRALKRNIAIGRALLKGGPSAAIAKQQQFASNTMAQALRATCMEYLKWLTTNIEQGQWRGSGGDLDAEYAEQKQKKHGFTHPIGVATGQLLDNVAPSSKNIELVKG